MAGARETRQALSEQRGAVGGARIVGSAVVLCARGRARSTHNIKKHTTSSFELISPVPVDAAKELALFLAEKRYPSPASQNMR